MDILDKMKSLEHQADNFGFSWETPDQIMEQIKSEVEEISEHLHKHGDLDRKALQEEIGDLFHAVMSLCVFCQFDPKETLIKTTDKFARRLESVQKLAINDGHSSLKGFAFSELMEYWNKAKKEVG